MNRIIPAIFIGIAAFLIMLIMQFDSLCTLNGCGFNRQAFAIAVAVAFPCTVFGFINGRGWLEGEIESMASPTTCKVCGSEFTAKNIRWPSFWSMLLKQCICSKCGSRISALNGKKI